MLRLNENINWIAGAVNEIEIGKEIRVYYCVDPFPYQHVQVPLELELLKDIPAIRTPLYKGHCQWSHLHTHTYKITTELIRTPLY